MGKDFGNAAADGQVFQIDDHFAAYRANTLQARSEEHGKYVCDSMLPDVLGRRVQRFIVERLLAEHPQYFRSAARLDGRELHCRLTGERLVFARDFAYRPDESTHAVQPAGGRTGQLH